MTYSTSSSYSIYCSKRNLTNILIFYDTRFMPRLKSKWDICKDMETTHRLSEKNYEN
jgi:hypothetical protein